MLEFYQAAEAVDVNGKNIAMTVIEGPFFGEKALAAGQDIIWASAGNGFFAGIPMDGAKADRTGIIDTINGIERSGSYTIDGTEVFCELLGREKELVVCGAGHVSIPIIQMGRMIGCRVTVLEDRPEFADNARRAGASQVICAPFGQGLSDIVGNPDTFFVIVTRGHRYDQICLEQIVKKEHAYIGMMGSRGRVAKVKEAIVANGCSRSVADSIYAPIGLAIDAQTPEEIAVSVIAQIVQVKNKQRRSGGFPAEIMDGILNGTDKGIKVLATIVKRKGSAPRETGTKMLVLPDGSSIGTVGGGFAEADILQKALLMIREHIKEPKLCRVDMAAGEAEDEGMACGGTVQVLLEPIW